MSFAKKYCVRSIDKQSINVHFYTFVPDAMNDDVNNFIYDRVLLIEDDETDIFISKRIITSSHFAKNIDISRTGEEALAYLSLQSETPAHLPDVIFLDISLPGMNGHEFLTQYEKMNDTVKNFCKVFVLSNFLTAAEEKKISGNPHVLKCIEKPLEAESLKMVLSKR